MIDRLVVIVDRFWHAKSQPALEWRFAHPRHSERDTAEPSALPKANL